MSTSRPRKEPPPSPHLQQQGGRDVRTTPTLRSPSACTFFFLSFFLSFSTLLSVGCRSRSLQPFAHCSRLSPSSRILKTKHTKSECANIANVLVDLLFPLVFLFKSVYACALCLVSTTLSLSLSLSSTRAGERQQAGQPPPVWPATARAQQLVACSLTHSLTHSVKKRKERAPNLDKGQNR